MTDENKLPVYDMASLQAEKKRLEAVCAVREEKLRAHVRDLRENYSKMAINSLLPFEDNTREKISGVLDLMNESIIPSILGFSLTSRGSSFKRNLFKVAQAIIISLSFRLFKRFLGKKNSVND